MPVTTPGITWTLGGAILDLMTAKWIPALLLRWGRRMECLTPSGPWRSPSLPRMLARSGQPAKQGDFPLSTDLKFLILRLQKSEAGADTVVLSYDLGEQLDEKDLTKQIEDDIKRQISEKYSMPPSSVSRTEGAQKFLITVKKEQASEFYDGNSVPNNQDSPDSVNDVGDDENSKTKSNSGDGWSTGEIVVISLLVTTGVVASLILLLFFIRPAFLVFVIYINSSLLRL